MDKPRVARIGKSTKVLITLAGGVIVMMLGTMAIVNGFWADKVQRVSEKIRNLTRTTFMPTGSRVKEFDAPLSASLARQGPPPQEAEKLLPDGLEKPATPATKKQKDFGEAREMPSPLRGSNEPRQTPASSSGFSGAGGLASAPLPDGFGHVKIKDEISPINKQELPISSQSREEIKPETPGEVKQATEISSKKEEAQKIQEKILPGQPSEATLSSTRPAAPPQVSSASKLVVQAGANLTRIVARNYPENQKISMAAVILANPAITIENKIHPGQRLYLPEINFTKQTIRLEDNLFYAIYGVYLSEEDLKGDTTWLTKKKVHFVVRNTRDSSGKAMHRVFLGGYTTEGELEGAFGNVKTR